MKRSFEAIKKKFCSPLAGKRTGRMSIPEEVQTETKDRPSDKAAYTTTCNETANGTTATKELVRSTAEQPVSYQVFVDLPSSTSLSQPGVRKQPVRDKRSSKFRLVTNNKVTISSSEDSKAAQSSELPTDQSEEITLFHFEEFPHKVDFSIAIDTSTYATVLATSMACLFPNLTQPYPGRFQLPIAKETVLRLQNQLTPARLPSQDRSGVEPKSRNLGGPESSPPLNLSSVNTREENLSAEWITSLCDRKSPERMSSGSKLQQKSDYENQSSEFHQIWSSKKLQMAEVAACMMQSDFQYLSMIR